MSECLSLRRLASLARSLAMEKAPAEEPLIVQTQLYTSIATESEILGVAINAPYGSGKTVGIGLKSYHDSKVVRPPIRDGGVILLRARLLNNKSQAFHNYIRGNVESRLMCGGPYVTALWLVAKHYDMCADSRNKGCYTSLSREEARIIENILDGNSLGRRAQRVPTVSNVAGLLEEVRKGLRRPLYIIIDEVEGFLDVLGARRPGELIYSNMAFSAALYDEGIRYAKLVLLIQSAHIGEEWGRLVSAVRDGVPYPQASGAPHKYVCEYPGGVRDSLGTEAVAGRVSMTMMRYYNESVYVQYIREVLRRAANKCETPIYDEMYNEIMDPAVAGSVRYMLEFLKSIAPRIGFDYVDEILENVADHYTRGSLREAFKKALRAVADSWTTGEGIKKYYGLIFMGEDIFTKGLNNNQADDFVKKLAESVYTRVFDVALPGQGCSNKVTEAVSYYSTVTGAVACRHSGRNVLIGLLVFRRTRSPIRKPSKTLARRIGKLVIGVVSQVLDSGLGELKIYGLTLAPEGVDSLDILTLNRFLIEELPGALAPPRSGRGSARRAPSIERWENYRLKPEDMAVLLAKIIHVSGGTGPEYEFVDKRFEDIIAELAASLTR